MGNLYLVSDIISELKENGINVTRQSINYLKKKMKHRTHYKQSRENSTIVFTERGRTKLLKHYGIKK